MYSDTELSATRFSATSTAETSGSSLRSRSTSSAGSRSSVFSSTAFGGRFPPPFGIRDSDLRSIPKRNQVSQSVFVGSESTMEPEMELFASEREGVPVTGREGATVEESANEETVLLAMRELHTTLRKEFQDVKSDMEKLLEMQTSLVTKMTAIDKAVQGLDSSSARLSPPLSARRVRSLHETKLQFLAQTFNDANAAVPLIQLACILTTTSISKRMPQLHGIVSDGVANYLGDLQEVVGEATGFGVLMFAVRGNASKAKFQFATGKLWTFWLKRSLNAAITFAKKHLYRPAEDVVHGESGLAGSSAGTARLPKEPEWLKAMDTCENIEATINEVIGRLEATDRSTPTTSSVSNDSGPPLKRPRNADGDYGNEGLRVAAGMQIRAVFTSVLNSGRAEVRSYLYLQLFFIVHRLKEFSDRDVARSAGFDVIFGEQMREEELHPAGLSGIWNIPMAKIGNSVAQRNQDSGCDFNLRALQKLRKDFPCLSLEIRYQREVKQASGGALDRDGRTVSVRPVMWPDVDKISLHVVAANMLMELVCAKSISMVLAASKLSLRTVHILAIALRGLMLRSLESLDSRSTDFVVTDVALTELERNVIGNVVYDHIPKTADLVSVKMDELKAGGKLAVRLAANREKKFSLSFEEYKKAVEDAERERARSAAIERAAAAPSQGRVPVHARNSNDDWLFGG